ncbi:MAG TPA: DUF2064 domain-containing protein [Frankiaceae bacterium]|nr:DUF2064 domain-containing protein [Frankiaceae bacterium]
MGPAHPTATNATSPPAFRLLVMAKAPVAGRVKTRLCPPFTPGEAAELAAAAIADTLAAVMAAVPLAARRGMRVEPVLVLDGAPGSWLTRLLENEIEGQVRLPVVAQREGGLDARLAGAFQDATANLPALLVGMDTPQLTPGLLVQALETLARPGCDAVLGHAEDGGWWTLGLRKPDPALLLGVPMSTPWTGKAQQSQLIDADLTVSLLPELRDVDTVEDAEQVAGLVPGSRFARTLRGLRLPAALAL